MTKKNLWNIFTNNYLNQTQPFSPSKHDIEIIEKYLKKLSKPAEILIIGDNNYKKILSKHNVQIIPSNKEDLKLNKSKNAKIATWKNINTKFDLIISTVNVKLDWNLFLNTLKPRGRLHFVGATTEPLDVSIFALMGAQRSISSSPVGSPATIKKMLDFAKLHNIEPQTETFPFEKINDAISHLRNGKAKYRVVLKR